MARQRNWRVFVAGADELVRMFDDMTDEAIRALDEATRKGAEIVHASSRQNVPVLTGKLRDSLDIKPERARKNTKRGYQIYSKGVRKGGVRYAFAVEGGHKTRTGRQIAPVAFLRRSLDENKNRVKTVIMRELGDAIERAAR